LVSPPGPKPAPVATDKGGAWRPAGGRLVIALLLAVAGGAALWLLLMPSRTGPGFTAVDAAAPATSPVKAVASTVHQDRQDRPQRPPQPAPEGDADPTPDLKSYVARGENPAMSEVIERLHARGVHSGLGAFSPPGTRPPLVGLAVPEDFVLPKGYIRHHQATDDGQRIEAILMFAPGYQMVDANNDPIAMPENRVVPPALAPPGLPIRRIVLPLPIEPARTGL
jgi:hypothetical protein